EKGQGEEAKIVFGFRCSARRCFRPNTENLSPNTNFKTFQISIWISGVRMAVKLRMKKLGRKHRPFFRICAMDSRTPRDGRAIEELGTYDPMVPDADARVKLARDRVAYWLSVGAQPSPKVAVLIRKYGEGGTHV